MGLKTRGLVRGGASGLHLPIGGPVGVRMGVEDRMDLKPERGTRKIEPINEQIFKGVKGSGPLREKG